MKKSLPQDHIAELMMICGAIHDLAEIVAPDKASHLHIIQHKLERIIATQALKPSIAKLLNSIDAEFTNTSSPLPSENSLSSKPTRIHSRLTSHHSQFTNR